MREKGKEKKCKKGKKAMTGKHAAPKERTGAEREQALSDLLYLSACSIQGIRPARSRVERMEMESLYCLCRFHALTNLVFEAVLSAYDGNLPDRPVLKKWREERDKAVTKNLLLDAERAALFFWMEQAGIWYLPLKGCVLKDLYPKSGMRQMADNDILFDAACQERVRDWFAARGYEVKSYKQGVHDCYLKAPVYNFEMHTALFSAAYQPDNRVFADYYKDVKRRLLPDAGRKYGYHFSDEDFYLYFLAHARKHFLGGGTGLRTLLDVHVYLSAKGKSLDWDKIRAELPKLGLTEFERQARELAGKVFADPESFSPEQLTEEEQHLLGYYLASGTYGTTKQRVKNRLTELAGADGSVTWRTRLRYVWNRLFPDQKFLEAWCRSYAPFFLRHPWLMPAAPIWRILTRGLKNIRQLLRELRAVVTSAQTRR